MTDRLPLRNDRRNWATRSHCVIEKFVAYFHRFSRHVNGELQRPSKTLRYNERTKHFAGVLIAAGNALLIAAFAKVWVEVSFDLNSLTWLIMAALLFWLSSNMLKLLDAEENDG